MRLLGVDCHEAYAAFLNSQAKALRPTNHKCFHSFWFMLELENSWLRTLQAGLKAWKNQADTEPEEPCVLAEFYCQGAPFRLLRDSC